MFKDHLFPFVGAWNQCLHAHWFHHSQTLFQHPGLSQDEKFLWMWLATTQENANESTIRCSFSYEQLSTVMNQPGKLIHHILFKLKLMGFLRGPLPVTYQKLTMETLQEVRELVLCIPSETFLTCQKALREINKGVVLNIDRRNYLLKKCELNLLAKNKENAHCNDGS